jgi:large subunit ribosomal protein L25
LSEDQSVVGGGAPWKGDSKRSRRNLGQLALRLIAQKLKALPNVRLAAIAGASRSNQELERGKLMDNMVVEVEPRASFGKGANRRLRGQGKVPAIIYGQHQDPVAVTVASKELVQILRSQAGMNTIFGILIKGAKGTENVMIKDYQLEPIEHELLHADLIRITMDTIMTVSVHVKLVGVAEGVKNEGGILDFVTRTVDVSCLPTDIPETIPADVTGLALGQLIRAGDLEIPEKVTLESEPGVVVAHVIEPKKVEEVVEEEAAEAPVDEEAATEPEVIKKGKAEDEDKSSQS